MGFVPKVAVMVLNFNGRVWLERCLSSLLKLEYPNLDIHLIDNGSSDGSVDYLTLSATEVGRFMLPL